MLLLLVDWGSLFNLCNVLGLAGVAVGIAGWRAGVQGNRRAEEAERKVRSAEDAAKRARQRLLIQRAAEDFTAITKLPRDLVMIIAKNEAAPEEPLADLRGHMAEANGSFQSILKGIDMDRLGVAIHAVEELQGNLPPGGRYPPEQMARMSAYSQQVADLVSEIYGRLKYLEIEDLR